MTNTAYYLTGILLTETGGTLLAGSMLNATGRVIFGLIGMILAINGLAVLVGLAIIKGK